MSSDGLNRRERVVDRNGDTNEENVSRVVSQEVSPERPQNQSIMKRVMSLMALSMAILVVVYYTTQCNDTKELMMASATQSITGSPVGQQVMCSQDYNEDRVRFPSCAPQRCGRFVSDSVITESEAKHLLSVTKRGLSLGGSSGGASFFSLHSGDLSMATNFVNIYKLMDSTQQTEELFTKKDFEVYRTVTNRIRKTIAIHFGISSAQLYITIMTVFRRSTAKKPRTKHDVYWRRHVDKRERKVRTIHFFAVFVDIWRGLLRRTPYIDGRERNEHFFERVTNGTRYALVMAFTCDPEFAAKDPQI
ncbi:unnamed protein product, partial [Oppiella nova]